MSNFINLYIVKVMAKVNEQKVKSSLACPRLNPIAVLFAIPT